MPAYVALTCAALTRSVQAAAADAPHPVQVTVFPQGLHNTPARLRDTLQTAIDAIPAGTCDAILLAYGLCGTATAGLVAHHIPLVLPRAHDCVTLYLGSRERYQREFDAHPGTYWYSMDYLEHGGSPDGLGAAGDAGAVYADYAARFGEDNAAYLMDVMKEWQRHYDRAVYIDTGHGGQAADYERLARAEAARRGWRFQRMGGDDRLLRMLLSGDWPPADFLTVPPGHRVEQAGPGELMRAAPV